MVTDMGAAMNASLVLIGDKLGLFKALADKGPMSSEELAKATGTHERYVREWLFFAGGLWLYRIRWKSKFSLTAEQVWSLRTRKVRPNGGSF
jgi:hypothetical protein